MDISAPLILIIDDNPVDRQLATTLVRHEFPELSWRSVTESSHFEEALEGDGFQAVLIDYWLHWSTGLEAAVQVRERFPDIPIIFLCGEVSDAIRTRIFQFAPADFIPKTATGFLLLPGALRRHLERASLQAARRSAEGQERVESRGPDLEFASIASHQLQEPLRMVAQYTRLLSQEWGDRLDAGGRECIHFAHDGAQRLQQLVDDLLAFSRAAERELERESCDCTQLVQQALQELNLLIQQKRAIITWKGLPVIRGDCNALAQVFQNLISNAVKYYQGREVPRLRIWCERRGRENWFHFRDNGPGVPPEQQETIFKPFHRGPTEVAGSGLGLAISRRIVERHGGRLWLEETTEPGSTFILALPVTPVD